MTWTVCISYLECKPIRTRFVSDRVMVLEWPANPRRVLYRGERGVTPPDMVVPLVAVILLRSACNGLICMTIVTMLLLSLFFFV